MPARRPNKAEKPAAERIDAEAHFVKRKTAIVGGDTDIRSEHQFETCIETLAVDDGDEGLAAFWTGGAGRIHLAVLGGALAFGPGRHHIPSIHPEWNIFPASGVH